MKKALCNKGGDEITIPTSSVYSCKKIVVSRLENSTKIDYAIIELDRNVEDRAPLSFNKTYEASPGDKIFVIGNPSGIPTKIAANAKVRESNADEVYFSANLDTFGGNSGSAVFNQNNEVIGILVRGEIDYVFDPDKSCYEVYKCDDDGCSGEDVTKMSAISEL